MSEIVLMTFNIRGSTFGDGPNVWKNRAELNIETITSRTPDIIGFQEFQTGNMADYDGRFPEYDHVIGPPYNRPGRIFYNTVFYRSDRFTTIDSGGFYLSTTPEIWSKSWDAARVHVAVWILFWDLTYEVKFLVVNTHLDHLGPKARLKSAELISERLAELSDTNQLPVMLMGDFNCPPEKGIKDSPYELLARQGLKDVWGQTGGASEAGTYHGFHGKEVSQGFPSKRLDWILYSDGLVRIIPLSCHIVDDSNHPLYPSDHYPVMARLKFKA